jgi:hypothetical protein
MYKRILIPPSQWLYQICYIIMAKIVLLSNCQKSHNVKYLYNVYGMNVRVNKLQQEVFESV